MIIASIRRLSLAAFTAAASVVVATPLSAQQLLSTPDPVAATRSQPAPPGPTVDRGAVGVRPLSQSSATLDASEEAMQQRLGLGQARALMIVGFAAVVIGLLMDNDPGTLIAVGGAVVGLYGLYHYLR